MTYSIEDELGEEPKRKKRKSKPKNYGDRVWNSQAKVGDVVYLPSSPDVKMTVVRLPNINYAAHTSLNVYEVTLQWLDANNQMTEATINSRSLLQD